MTSLPEIAILLASLAGSVQAEPLTPEKAIARWTIQDLQLSPDGARLAFTVTEPVKGMEQNRDIYLLDTDTREVRRFTASPRSDTHPRWSPDGKNLAFLSDRAEDTQIYVMRVEGGEPIALTEGHRSITAFEWSPDGERIAFLAPEPKTDEEDKKEKDKDDARAVDKDDRLPRLWILEVESRQVRMMTPGPWRVSGLAWVKGDRLLVSATDDPQPELETERVFAIALGDGELKLVASPPRPFGGLKVSPDGRWLAYVGSREDGPVSHDLFLVPVEGGTPRNLSGRALDRPIGGFAWAKDGTFLALAQLGFASTFYRLEREGKSTEMTRFDVRPTAFAGEIKRLFFVGESATRLPELYTSSDRGRAERLSHFNASWDDVALVSPEVVRYPSFDGTLVEAVLLRPAGAPPDKPLPMVVLVHGGPAGAWSDRFEPWGQLLVDRGYAVLYPNIRGSTGYGHDFLVKNRADWGGADFKDVMTGVDFLVAKGVADPERLGIGGWSYGGYMAAWAVTQTNRFKASVSGAPMTDLASEYGTEMASINAYDTWYLNNPYENLQLFVERSPVTHVRNARTPTLLLCGNEDVTDPVGQCYQFHRGLKRYSVPTELVLYPREGHSIREEKHQIDVLRRVVSWFERYLGDGSRSPTDGHSR